MEEQEKRMPQDAETNQAQHAGTAGPEAMEDASNSSDRDIAELEARLAEAQAKAAEMQDAFLRSKAEVENMRRRAQEDISKAHKFAIENFAEALLPVRDSLEMALKIDTPSVEALKEGVEMTLKQLNSAFEKNRLIEVAPQTGDKLDPMKHQAISTVPADQEANTIVTLLQKGYTIADRLLRPALVTVSQGKSSQES